MTRWSDLPDAELDQRLADELQAMANSPRLGPDWARLELLPAVRSGLGEEGRTARPPRWSPAGVAGIVGLLLIVVAIAFVRPTGSLPGGPYGEAREGDFTLTISADKPFYAPGEAMRVVASLTYDGEEAVVRLAGVEHLIAGFAARQLDGPLAMGPGWDEPCLRHELRKGESVRREFAKSAGWGADDPHADFYRRWATDPQLWLPAGRWQLTAIADFSTGEECGTGVPVRVQATLEVEVRDRGASPAPAPTPPSTWAALNTRDFAARVAAGELRGRAVPVVGEIRDVLIEARGDTPPPCRVGDLCPIGQLAGVDPPLLVHGRPVATLEGSDAEQGRVGDSSWEWWHMRHVPDGVRVFLLRVLDDGTVEYLGYQDEEHPWGLVSLLDAVQPEEAPLDEVVFVPGWLIGTATTSCPAGDLGSIADLPGRLCTPHAWIGPDPVRLPGPFDPPPGAVQVQSGAYAEFGGTDPGATAPEPVPGLWALARRLERAGCPDDRSPCWRWNLIAKVTYQEPGPAEPVTTPEATDGPTTAPSSDPTGEPDSSPTRAPGTEQPTLLTCFRPDGGRDLSPAALTDYAGAVDSCDVGVGTPGQAGTTITNPGGDLRRLRIEWGGSMCLRDLSVEVAAGDADGNVIVVLDSQGTTLESACPAALSRPALMLTMNRAVAASQASVYLMYDGRVTASTDTSAGSFSVALDRDRREYAAGEPIEIDGVLVYSGPTETVSVSGLPSALGVFLFEQLDGDLDMSRFVSRVPCVGFELHAGRPVRTDGSPLRGVVFENDDPNAAFYRQWSESDELWLPAGVWKVTIAASFAVGPQGCGGEDVNLVASIVIRVVEPETDLTPVPDPDGLLDCANADTSAFDVQLTDYAGVAAACVLEEGVPPADDVEVINPGGDRLRLRVDWPAQRCVESMSANLLPPDSDGTMHLIIDHQGPSEDSSCPITAVDPALVIELTDPIPDFLVEVVLTHNGESRVAAQTTRGNFSLRLWSASYEYAAGEPIDLDAELIYHGPSQSVTVMGDPLLTRFSFRQVDGVLDMSNHAETALPGPCPESEIPRDAPVRAEGRPGRNFFIAPDDPNAGFYEEWMNSSELWLPAGVWQVSISSPFYLGGCGHELVTMTASILIVVR